MKKKTFISLAAIVVCLALAVVAVATASGMKIVVEFKNNSTAGADELVTAVVSVKGYDTDMAGLQYEFTYNTDDMEFVKAEIAPDFYAKTVQFGADDAANEAYASFVKADASPYFSVSEASGTGTLRFVSIADSGSYADLGTNFTLFTVTLKSKKQISSLSGAVTPSTDFNLLGAPATDQGTSAITFTEQNTNPYIADVVSNAITNLKVETFKTNSKYSARNITVSLIDSASKIVKSVKVKESDLLLQEDGSYLSELFDINNVDSGTYSIKIEKQYCKPITISNIVLSVTNTVVDISKKSLPDLVLFGGDVNGDGSIDMVDVSKVIADFGTASLESTDINGDGAVDMVDVSMVISNFGVTPDYNLN